MKRILGVLVVFIMLFSTTAFAVSEPQVSFIVNGKTDGKVLKGEKITINVVVKDVTNLYALSTDYIYNPEFLKVNSIESDGLIKESKLNLMQPGGETDKDGNRANYQMTFTGKVDGVSGSGPIVKIEAEVLKDFSIELTEDNMKIKLVKVDKDYNVDMMGFIFNSLKSQEDTTGGNVGGEDTGNTGTTENTGDTGNIGNNGSTSGTTEDAPVGENSSNAEAESKPSKPNFIDKITSFFVDKTEVKPEVEADSNVSESTNEADEITSNKEDSSKGNNENSNNESEKNSIQKTSLNSNGIILIASIIVMAIGGVTTLIIRKKYNNKTIVENISDEKENL